MVLYESDAPQGFRIDAELWARLNMHSNHTEILDPARLHAVESVARQLGNFNESFEGSTRTLASLLEAPIVVFALVDQDKQIIQGAYGLPMRETSATEGVFCRACVAQDDLLVVSDPMKDERFAHSPFVTGAPHLRFYAGVPVHAPNGKAVGTLCIVDTKAREFTEEHASILRWFRDNLEKIISFRTPLVQNEDNRDDFERVLHQKWRCAAAARKPISVLMIELDYLEAYNDQYEQPAGDYVSKATAAVIKTCFRRSNEIVTRYEGRFVVLISGAKEREAHGLAEHCRVSMEDLSIEHMASPYEIVTISIGVAADFPHKSLTGAVELVERSDWLLHEAKASGHNRTVASFAVLH